MSSGFRAGGRAFWSAFTKVRSLRTSGVAGLGLLLLGQTLRAKMVASYSFGSHFNGSSSYPKKSVLPDDCIIVTGSTNKQIAEEIAAHLGCKLFPIETGKFKDGETYIKFDSSIEGKHVILVCPQGSPANDSIFETLLLISSMKRNGAKSISLYLPYSCYARQDKMTGPWRSLAFSDLATYYENSGVDRVITLDIHNEAVMGCFSQSINAHNMTAINLAASYISQAEKLNNMVVLSPDEGGVKRAKKFFDYYQSQSGDVNADSKFVIMLKQRERPNEVASMTITSDVAGKDCILIDDMIDTGGTMMKAAKLLKEKGAKNIYVFATHGIFGTDFYDRLEDSAISKVFVTNSVAPPTGADKGHKLVRISISKLFADHIYKNSTASA